MELRIQPVAVPEQILFNYEELKQELAERTEAYATLQYTDDQIKEAKTDRANLNKLKKALNDERIRQERQYMQPFTVFKNQINELVGIIDRSVKNIDKQVKEYDQRKKEEKKDALAQMWESLEHDPALTFEDVFLADRMLNTTFSMKQAEEFFKDEINRWNSNINMLRALPEFAFEAVEIYKQTKSVDKAVFEAKQMSEIQKKKAEQQAVEVTKEETQVDAMIPGQMDITEFPGIMPEPQPQPVKRDWVAFQAYLSNDEALALAQYFKSKNIKFKPV